MRRLDLSSSRPAVSLTAAVARLPTDLERSVAERKLLYASARWRRERREYLRLHPMCSEAGCVLPSVAVDHRDGHQRPDWLARFWDRSTWQPLCRAHHNGKCAIERAAWRDRGESEKPRAKGAVTARVLRASSPTDIYAGSK